MTISAFDLFSIGIGPSSSHTVGPMRAAKRFIAAIDNEFAEIARVQIEIYGSLAWTGEGHGTRGAILAGLCGNTPEDVDPNSIISLINEVKTKKLLNLAEVKQVKFGEKDYIANKKTLLPYHSNGICFRAYNKNRKLIKNQIYYSVGGGFVVNEEEIKADNLTENFTVPYPFASAKELLKLCQTENLTIAQIMLANEVTIHGQNFVQKQLEKIWQVMQTSINNGLVNEGELPGGLKVKRRAPRIWQKLQSQPTGQAQEMNLLSVYSIAVNEENASGGRIVTAPTNGAAGILPAVLRYCLETTQHKSQIEIIATFLLTAAAIGILYKKNASISAAEVGCQGEVGVACSMAAGAFTAVMDGTALQIENAAEIGMEHHLGLTCDPIGGLVQIPCIERNAMGSVQAVNAAKLALLEEGEHKVSLDSVIAAMFRTGKDMSAKYKETSQGGLAVNLPEC